MTAAITAEQYSRITGTSVGNARMRLEWMTAAGMAERRTYQRQATTFTITQTSTAEPVRIRVAFDGTELAGPTVDREKISIGLQSCLDRMADHEWTAEEMRLEFGYGSVQTSYNNLNRLKQLGLVRKTLGSKPPRWCAVRLSA